MKINSLDVGLLGEDALINDLSTLFNEQSRFIVNIYGDHGTGKTTLLQRAQSVLVNLPDSVYLSCTQELAAEDIDNLVMQHHVAFIDDVDVRFSLNQFKDIVLNLCTMDPNIRIVFSSKTKFFTDKIPGIPAVNLEIGNRIFDSGQFMAYIQHSEFTPIPGQVGFSDLIVKNLFLFATYCRNFNIWLELIQRLTDAAGRGKQVVTPRSFVEILTQSSFTSRLDRDLVIDTKHAADSDYLFVIRTKDKIEKLRDIILKYYPDEFLLHEVMTNQFNPSFVEETFKQRVTYPDKVLNICMSYDPVELLIRLLGPRDIIIELNEQKALEATFTYSIEDKAKLILKHIGLNIMEDLKGISYYSEWLSENKRMLVENQSDRMNKEYIIGLGISCYQEMEHVFHEMLQFYAVYYCGSLLSFMKLYNDSGNQRVLPHRLTFGQYIGLFTFLNKLAKEERFQLKTLHLGRAQVIPSHLIVQLEELSSHRAFVAHNVKMSAAEAPHKTYRNRIATIYNLALSIAQELKNNEIYPEIIKIKQIVFDEFGRTLYVASDWKKGEIRFSLSNPLSHVHIFSHYYLLRKNQSISINPILIPRYFEEREALFQNSEQYDQSSQTQSLQGASLISHLTLADQAKILDVGCGNGKTTIELYRLNPSVTIDAFDVSQKMIDTAIKNRDEAGIPEASIQMFAMDVMKLEETAKYDLVFSNAVLHWMTDSQGVYTKLHHSLIPGGKLAIQQGGMGCYRGLHQYVREAIEQLDLQSYYHNWNYPIFYPSKNEMEQLLKTIGFRNVKVLSIESDGTEFPDLVENFANAGMLPYLKRLPDEAAQRKLLNRYYQLCRTKKPDTYTHRIYAFATREDDLA